MELKDRLKAARKYARLTQIEVSDKVEISQGTYSQLERGLVKSTSKIVELADLFGVNPMWLSTGVGEAFSNTGANIQHNGDNCGNIVGGIGNTQNNLTQNVSVQDQAKLDEITANYYKSMPLLDINMGVKYAINPYTITTLILDNSQKILAHIPHTSNTFGIQLSHDIVGVIPSILLKGDILIIEPCMSPQNNDLVLVCLDFGKPTQRGMVGRLLMGISGKPMLQYNEFEPEPMPVGSLICGVVIAIKRHTIDNAMLTARIVPEWDITKTLVVDDKKTDVEKKDD